MTSTSGDLAIAICDLRKSFAVGFARIRSVTALAGVSLSVPRGRTFGFLGPNGAGKSTTIKTLTGLIFPTSGTVSVLGKAPTDPEAHRRMGYLPENPSFHDHLTGHEILTSACRLAGVAASIRSERIRDALHQVQMQHASNLQVRRYSKGMVQRLGIAQALVHDPELIILDEPMSGLDPVGRRDMKDLIAGLHRQGRTIFFSTHIISDVEELCDEVAIVIGGRVVRHGKVSDLLGTEAREVEVLAARLPSDFSPQAGELGTGSVSLQAANEADARELIERIWSVGGRVIGVKTRRYGLEDVFLEEVAKQPAKMRIEE